MKQKIIDAHMHPCFENKILGKSANEADVDFNLKSLLREFKRYNIVKAVALPIFTNHLTKEKIHFTVKNNEIKKFILKNKEKFIGACTISPLEFTQNDLNVLEEEIKKNTFKAIKLFPGYEYFYPSQDECSSIYELAKRNNIPVLFHTGDTWGSKTKLKYSQPLNIDEVAVSFPDVKFVICHLGNPWIMDAVEVAYKNKNVYADLSGFVIGKKDSFHKKFFEVWTKKIMEGICYDKTVIDKLMFGTDYPLVKYDFCISFIRKLGLIKKEFNKIFFENSTKFFNIKC